MQIQNKPRWILRNPSGEYPYWQIKFGEFPLSFEFNIGFSDLVDDWVLTDNSLDWRNAMPLEIGCEGRHSEDLENAKLEAERILFEAFSHAQDLFQQLPF